MWECGIDGCEYRDDQAQDLLVHQTTAHEPHTCKVCEKSVSRGYFAIRHVFEQHGRDAFEHAYDLSSATIREHEKVVEAIEAETDLHKVTERISAERTGGEAVADMVEPTDQEAGAWQPRTDLLAFGVVLGLLVLAEGLILFQYGDIGILTHVGTITVIVAFVHRSEEPTEQLFQSLLLLPILRIFNLGLPIFTDDPLVFLGTIYLFLLMSTVTVVRSQDLGLTDLGLTWTDAHLVIPGVVIGLLFGVVQYAMGLEHLAYEQTLRNYILLVLTAGILVGFVEEVIFRGLVQRWTVDLLGQWPAIVVVSALFGFMHSIWLAPMDIVFAGVVSVFLGWTYSTTNNMWFITSVHGMINVGAFLLAPLYGATVVDIITAVPYIG